MPKPFIDLAQQVALLKSKHLLITDENEAKRTLFEIGYFTLIGGYKHLFKNRTTRQYRDNVTFSDIVMLYNFDGALRRLFLRYLLMIERTIKTRIAYVFCEAHGESQTEYLNAQNYNTNPQMHNGVAKLIQILSALANHPTDYPYINHQQNTHHNVPLWVLINAITFGSMSKMFGFLPQNLQSKIARCYPLIIPELQQVLIVLTKFRNACAHGERLFSYTTRDDIPNLLLHPKLGIPVVRQQYLYGKHDLFAVVIAFRYLLPASAFHEFKGELQRIISKFSNNCNSLAEADLLQAMGFPLDWKKISHNYKLR